MCLCVRSRVIYRGNIASLVEVVENRCNCRRNFKCPLYSRQSAQHMHAYNVYAYYTFIYIICNIGIVYAATAKRKRKATSCRSRREWRLPRRAYLMAVYSRGKTIYILTSFVSVQARVHTRIIYAFNTGYR